MHSFIPNTSLLRGSADLGMHIDWLSPRCSVASVHVRMKHKVEAEDILRVIVRVMGQGAVLFVALLAGKCV